MMNFIGGPAGGLKNYRTHGTQVTLAGRTAFLPNNNVPIVVQDLTMEQINDIPKNRFAISLIETPRPMTALGRWSRARLSRLNFQTKQQKRLARSVKIAQRGRTTDFLRIPSISINEEKDATKMYTVAIAALEKAKENINGMYYSNCELSRNNGGEPSPKSALFYAPIDEGRLSDCFMKIIADYFGDGDKCKLYGHEFKLHEFCLFVHYYFRRIGIMKTNARQPFSEYVRKSVLKDEAAFTDKTFNNAARLYEDKENEFTDKKLHEINFEFRPSKDAKSNNPLQQLLYAFQDIGYNFHNSDYFIYLRDIRKRMNEFYL